MDDVALPVDNPVAPRRTSRRHPVPGGRHGHTVTLDGDVWPVRGLHEPGGRARWKRFTSGLHEPLTLAIRDDQIYVFDRNGIWRLRDTNADGEADVHELFSNAFAQTADMREFPNTLRLAPGGEFVIAKGNQQATTSASTTAHVLRISADGRRPRSSATDFGNRISASTCEPALSPRAISRATTSPSTPIHIVKDHQFYGFLADKQPREVYPAPIADPLMWLPHPVNASAMSQVWLFGARMGPLNDALIHIGYNKPELFRVLIDDRSAKPQAAVVSVTRAFDYPPLNGSVNPADGQLYIAGFQIFGWGTTATRLAGLGEFAIPARSSRPTTVHRWTTACCCGSTCRSTSTKAVEADNYSVYELALPANLQVRIAAAARATRRLASIA